MRWLCFFKYLLFIGLSCFLVLLFYRYESCLPHQMRWVFSCVTFMTQAYCSSRPKSFSHVATSFECEAENMTTPNSNHKVAEWTVVVIF